MKILLVNKYWYLRGGAERMVFLTKQLLEAAGHEVEIFGMRHKNNVFQNEFFVDTIDYKHVDWKDRIRFGFRSIYNRQAKRQFAQLIEKFQPDVVHFHNIYHQLSFSLVDVLVKKKIPSVLTLHDYKMISPNYNLFHHGKIQEESLGKKYYRAFLHNCMEDWAVSMMAMVEVYWRSIRRYASKIDIYISSSQFLKDKFVEAGWQEKRIVVVPNALSISQFPKNLDDDGYVGFFGRVSEEKGVQVLFEVAKITPEIPYRIVGDGPLLATLKKRASLERVTNIIFDGYHTGQSLHALMNGARIIVVPSLWYENAPLSILEAKSIGKVIVGSAIGGIPEMLAAEFLVPPGNVIALADSVRRWYGVSEDLRGAVGTQFHQEVEVHNAPENYLQNIEQVYRQALSNKII